MRQILTLIFLLIFGVSANAQYKLVVNEFSQGPAGSQEFIELVVVGTKTCTDSTADISNYIVDDNCGWYGAPGYGFTSGFYRFKNCTTWQKVPYGSIIVLYNASDPNPLLPPPDSTDANKDFIYIVPIATTGSSNLESNPQPAAADVNFVYPTTGYVPTSSALWQFTIGYNNTGDAINIVSPGDLTSPHFSISYGPLPPPGYKTATIHIGAFGPNTMYYLTDANYTNVSSWSVGVPGTNETPGTPNSGANATWINSMRASPAIPTTPTAYVSQQPICTLPTGTIQITNFLGAFYLYSIGGPFYNTNTITDVPPGTYYMIVRNTITGCISAPSAPIIVNSPTPPSAPVVRVTQLGCSGATTGSIVVLSPLGNSMRYSLNGAPVQQDTTFANLIPNTYNITVTDTSTGCTSSVTTVTINPQASPPPLPAVTITQPNCSLLTGTISISSPLGGQYKYSIGAAYQSSPVFSTLPPNTSYDVTVIDTTSGCASTLFNVLINPIPSSPDPPVIQVIQPPICGNPRGTFRVSYPSGPNYRFWINSLPPQTSDTFFNVLQGSQIVHVKDITTNCETQIGYQFNPPPPPGVATASIIQPTCSIPGTITVNSPLGNNFEYSIGGSYQSSTTFSGLTPGISYYLTVKDLTTHCESLPLRVDVNSLPTPPDPAVTSLIQPDCINTTGTISITSPLDPKYKYSIGTGYQYSPVFTLLPPNTNYNVTIIDTTTGCVSIISPASVYAIPGQPNSPATDVIHPNCNIITGTISILSPLDSKYKYSIGSGYQSSPIFSLLPPGTNYNVTIKDTTTGCVSVVVQVGVNGMPAPPNLPVTDVIQPNCIITTGTISITYPQDTKYKYSIGSGYQSSPVFSLLPSNTNYNVSIIDTTTGCISLIVPVSIAGIPNPPGLPVTSVIQPNCYITTGTISITSPLDPKYTYSIGTGYQSSPIFSLLPPGTNYNVNIKDTITGCVSVVVVVNVNNIPAPPNPAVTSVIHPDCIITTGTISIISPQDPKYKYSIGTGYQTSPIFSLLPPGTSYNVTIKDTITGCVSSSIPVLLQICNLLLHL